MALLGQGLSAVRPVQAAGVALGLGHPRRGLGTRLWTLPGTGAATGAWTGPGAGTRTRPGTLPSLVAQVGADGWWRKEGMVEWRERLNYELK